jgi:hypothetical protein
MPPALPRHSGAPWKHDPCVGLAANSEFPPNGLRGDHDDAAIARLQRFPQADISGVWCCEVDLSTAIRGTATKFHF